MPTKIVVESKDIFNEKFNDSRAIENDSWIWDMSLRSLSNLTQSNSLVFDLVYAIVQPHPHQNVHSLSHNYICLGTLD
jgi:hypothetical protein